ncbi:MAG: hypothetical protein QOF78_2401 [Phycisphaerales bacterium]|jgi:hypothetical protein|nr:hypothetical protein [Phycisphaerales bacterium]
MDNRQDPAESLEATGTLSYTQPLSDRRVATRHKQMFVTQMTPWSPGSPSIPFEVILEDVSDTGAGVIHERPCKIGMRHLLTVPRDGAEKPMLREYNIVRCDLRPDGKYSIGLELITGMTMGDADTYDPDEVAPPPRKRVTSDRLKLLFLAFGLVCLLVAFFVPL